MAGSIVKIEDKQATMAGSIVKIEDKQATMALSIVKIKDTQATMAGSIVKIKDKQATMAESIFKIQDSLLNSKVDEKVRKKVFALLKTSLKSFETTLREIMGCQRSRCGAGGKNSKNCCRDESIGIAKQSKEF